MKEMILRECSYSPGYSDMRGARHSERLAKDDDGGWIVVCSDREYYNAPTVVTVYAVSAGAGADFETFLKKSKVLSLVDRKKSDDFICDYHPWEFRIIFDDVSLERGKQTYCRIEQYKKYSAKDKQLIRELRERFRLLRGQKISEMIREND